jgi:hypothetical protein
MSLSRATALLGLSLGFTLQAAPANAWWQWYSHEIPYGSVPGLWHYQTYPATPWVPELWPGQAWLWNQLAPLAGLWGPQLWQYPTLRYGPTTMWSSTMPTTGLYVQQNETPAGYQIRVHTGEPGVPAVDIGVQGGFLTIRSHPATKAAGGMLSMQQAGWATQSISLPADANVAAMQIQRCDGLVEIFIPRGR